MPVLLKWFPPSWVQIKHQNNVVYVDPAYMTTHFAKYPKKIEFSKWPDPIDGLPEELEKGDLILVTHDHKDHCKSITVNRLRHSRTLIVAPRSCTKALGNDITVIEPGEQVTRRNIKIRAVEAYNTPHGRSTRKIHRKGKGVGYMITMGGKTLYHAGDTDFIPEMNDLGKVDVALLPIGGKFTMDIHEAVEAAMTIHPKIVVPMHMHHLKADPGEFKREVEAKSQVKVEPLSIGEVYLLE